MESFLVALSMAILEKVLTKGTIAFGQFLALKKALEENEKNAKAYEAVVKDPKATREDRKRAEDSALS